MSFDVKQTGDKWTVTDEQGRYQQFHTEADAIYFAGSMRNRDEMNAAEAKRKAAAQSS